MTVVVIRRRPVGALLSMDMRQRIDEIYLAAGTSETELAERFSVGKSTAGKSARLS